MNRPDLTVLFSPEEIADRVKSIAVQINHDYQGKQLLMICVLKGAFMFFSDLIKHIQVRPLIDFVRVASYGSAVASSKTVSFTKDVEISLLDKHVLLVDDVVDSGRTIKFLVDQMAVRGALSLRVASLVDKQERREVQVQVDYAGFSVQEGFIVGYGLDYAEMFRELPAVYLANL